MQRDAWDKKYGEALEQAKEPFEKAAAIFASDPTWLQEISSNIKRRTVILQISVQLKEYRRKGTLLTKQNIQLKKRSGMLYGYRSSKTGS